VIGTVTTSCPEHAQRALPEPHEKEKPPSRAEAIPADGRASEPDFRRPILVKGSKIVLGFDEEQFKSSAGSIAAPGLAPSTSFPSRTNEHAVHQDLRDAFRSTDRASRMSLYRSAGGSKIVMSASAAGSDSSFRLICGETASNPLCRQQGHFAKRGHERERSFRTRVVPSNAGVSACAARVPKLFRSGRRSRSSRPGCAYSPDARPLPGSREDDAAAFFAVACERFGVRRSPVSPIADLCR